MVSKLRYVILASCFLVNFLVIGFSVGLGVIFVKMINLYGTSRAQMAPLQSLCSGLIYSGSVISSPFVRRFGTRVCCVVGGFVSGVSVMVASFVSSIPGLIALVGAIAGFGFSFCHLVSYVVIRQVFWDRAGFGESVIMAGGGLGAFCMPMINTFLLENFGWRGTFLLLSGLLLNICVLGLITHTFRRICVDSEQSDKRNDIQIINCSEVNKTQTTTEQSNENSKRYLGVAVENQNDGTTTQHIDEQWKHNNNREPKQCIQDQLDHHNKERIQFTDNQSEHHSQHENDFQNDGESYGKQDIRNRETQIEIMDVMLHECPKLRAQSHSKDVENSFQNQHLTNHHTDIHQQGDQLDGQLKEDREQYRGPHHRCRRKLAFLYNYLGLHVLKNNLFLVFVILEVPLWMSLTAELFLLVDIISEKGYDLETASYFLSAFAIASVVGCLFGGVVTSVCRVRGLSMAGAACFCSCCVALGISFVSSFFPLMLLVSVGGFALGVLSLSNPVVILELVGSEHYDSSLGLVFGIGGLSDLVSGPLGGIIRDVSGSYDLMLYGIAGVLFCIALIVWYLGWLSSRQLIKDQKLHVSTDTVTTRL